MAGLNGGKTVIILGPRQVGKTTLLKDLFGNDICNILNSFI